jgi:hypothetical protein
MPRLRVPFRSMPYSMHENFVVGNATVPVVAVVVGNVIEAVVVVASQSPGPERNVGSDTCSTRPPVVALM